ncbi:3-oxo-tetronate 4-phosphate decarboxylase [Acetobacter oeni]|uniref:3-oxo-tetronate 4-phosphate decarboxylase n=1 Tax=Acetobacter oeni TaxID=304077 RepID=A0A511XKT4_9PROT|nr:aldolase [Acetobacter oeni]MBB3883796.1 ribulose-5-phosphate 4-epimerase/fuculose-1-phosphate aldolase [Acetobacter oeni]NHO19861.1 aldolase [Acetobacter oeni]GBR10432.1 putative aldolase [Acetobacter oeni LMG 21952]GEN63550.1 class II aldolase [Acetobacter oeni]
MTEQSLREEICRIGRDLFLRGYTAGTAGNISIRLDDGWLITPTDACLGRLDPECLAKVSRNGEWISGDKPSKTLELHRLIFDARPDSRVIIHTHSTHLVALTLAGVWKPDCILPPVTPYQVMKVGRIPLIPYDRPGSPQVAAKVAKLAGSVRGVMLERLGPVIWGETPERASACLEELEETARLWLMTTPRPAPLTPDALDDLRITFGAVWE